MPAPRTVPLCGNSIGTDRRFLAAYLPEIEDYLHYRSVDVSTHQGAGPALVPRRVEGAPKKATSHRALDDIRESINELQFWRESIFRPADEPERPSRRSYSHVRSLDEHGAWQPGH